MIWGFDSSWELETGMGQLVSLGIMVVVGFIFRSQSSRPSVSYTGSHVLFVIKCFALKWTAKIG